MITRRLSGQAGGFTLVELLVTVSIVSALVALLVPAMLTARERARVDVCLSNCRQIGTAVSGYLDQTPGWRLPWYVEWSRNGERQRSGASAYGGFRPRDASWDGLVPTDSRPINRYLGYAPGTEGPLKTFVCPSDWAGYLWNARTASRRPVNDGAWRTWGNSYPINWHWLEPHLDPMTKWQDYYAVIDREGPRVLRRKIGGEASRFVVVMEDPADVSFAHSTDDSRTSLAQPIIGWHGRRNFYTLLFLDGHATHARVDARLSVGPTWSVW